jgi:ABC-type glycerol-3-phosphate transport system substrate-binding protein
MMKTRLAFAGLAALLTLAACGEEKGPGGVSREEERELDNAASMLDTDNSGTIAVPDDSLVANEAEIAAEENGGAAADGNGQ